MAELEDVTSITGSIPDIISGIKTVADMVAAQEGLKYNNYSFEIETKDKEEPEKPAPASTATPSKEKGATTATPAKKSPNKATTAKMSPLNPAPFLEIRESGGAGERSKSGFSFVLQRFSDGDSGENAIVGGYVAVMGVEGFDTAIGHQAEVEFGGFKVNGGHMLTFKGFLNPAGLGFCHFSGAILVTSDGKIIAQGYLNISPPQSNFRNSSTATGFMLTF